jgi:hypothetical protein
MEAYSFYSKYVLQDRKWSAKVFHVEDGKFTRSIRNQKQTFRLYVDQFWIGPGKVYVDVEDPVYYQLNYENVIRKYIYRGCTLLLCQLPVFNTEDYRKDFTEFRSRLSSMAIDHMIVPVIPAMVLKDEHIRFFGRHKVPFILIETSSHEDLLDQKWEWIKHAQSFSNIPLMYINSPFLEEKIDFSPLWQEICENYSISTLYQEIDSSTLSRETLRLSGISPFHGEFIENGSADYNLFDLNTTPFVDESRNFRYDRAIPVATIANGKVIKANHLILSEENRGQYQRISIPQHFVY